MCFIQNFNLLPHLKRRTKSTENNCNNFVNIQLQSIGEWRKKKNDSYVFSFKQQQNVYYWTMKNNQSQSIEPILMLYSRQKQNIYRARTHFFALVERKKQNWVGFSRPTPCVYIRFSYINLQLHFKILKRLSRY